MKHDKNGIVIPFPSNQLDVGDGVWKCHTCKLDVRECRCSVKADSVNHPTHYTGHPSGVECIDIVEHMNFCLGNAIKYIWRAGLKSDDPIEDLRKARWYIDREIQRLELEVAKAAL